MKRELSDGNSSTLWLFGRVLRWIWWGPRRAFIRTVLLVHLYSPLDLLPEKAVFIEAV